MLVLAIIGGVAVAAISLFACLILWFIAGNIYGGIKGADRLREIDRRTYGKTRTHWRTVRLGLRAWRGERYRNGYGTYWQVGALRIPVDGRDPIGHDLPPG